MKENLIEKSLYSHKSARLEASKPRAFSSSGNVKLKLNVNVHTINYVRYKVDSFDSFIQTLLQQRPL